MLELFKDMDKKVGELHDFLESKGIFYPDSIFLIDCYKAKIMKLHNQQEVE